MPFGNTRRRDRVPRAAASISPTRTPNLLNISIVDSIIERGDAATHAREHLSTSSLINSTIRSSARMLVVCTASRKKFWAVYWRLDAVIGSVA